VILEEQIGGDISDIVMIDGSKGYAIINDASFNTSIVSFDLDTQTKLDTILTSEGFFFADLAITSKKEVYVSWRQSENPGIRIIDGLTDQKITE